MTMGVDILIDDTVLIPAGIKDLDGFRRWVRSDRFPDRGRIDFIDGRIEVEIYPRELNRHSTPLTEVACGIANRVKAADLGHVLICEGRMSCPDANLSCQPDVTFLSMDSILENRVRLVPADEEPDSYVEIEGPPDLVVEVVNDTTAGRDSERLLRNYDQAGVREFWLVDARGSELTFQIFGRSNDRFIRVASNRDGFQKSHVLGASYRLDRNYNVRGLWDFDLIQSEHYTTDH
jgi:Uma2 family endonuclease